VARTTVSNVRALRKTLKKSIEKCWKRRIFFCWSSFTLPS
jgi:hypothetical protein